jgi:release factor glutamine methyltransferase
LPRPATPRALDAEHLMAHALGVSRSEMLLRHMAMAAPQAPSPALVARRAWRTSRWPISPAIQEHFFGLTFRVTPTC